MRRGMFNDDCLQAKILFITRKYILFRQELRKIKQFLSIILVKSIENAKGPTFHYKIDSINTKKSKKCPNSINNQIYHSLQQYYQTCLKYQFHIIPMRRFQIQNEQNFNYVLNKIFTYYQFKQNPNPSTSWKFLRSSSIRLRMQGQQENLFQFFSNSSDFHKSAVQFNEELKDKKTWNLKNILRYPWTEFIIEGDLFFKRVWQMIDHSQKYFWITTYAIDSSPAADTTLYKLIQALKRGVHVVLFVDNVQFWAKKQLINQFQANGGTFRILNPQWKYQSLKRYMDRDVWRRHHQKLIVSDSKAMIGSANIEGSYAGIKYGTSVFQDLNYYTENIILDQYRKHFTDVANFYSFRLDQKKPNNKLLEQLNTQFPNSEFYKPQKYELLHNDLTTGRRQVQTFVIDQVRKAEKDIKIIQPYHYPMLKFDREMINAIKRGVSSTILTAGKRDQPVFKSIFNYMLFQRLIRNNVSVYETTERMLHSKVYLFDDKVMTMGSMNNDRWSWKINNEVNIAIYDQRQCQQIRWYFEDIFKRTKKVSKQYTISSSRAAAITFWQKFLYLSQVLMNTHGNPDQYYDDNHDQQGHNILQVADEKI